MTTRYSPARALVMICLLTPALYLPGILLGFRWYFLALVLSIAAALMLLASTGKRPDSFRRIGLAMALWLGVNFMSALWAGDVQNTLISSFYLVVLSMFWLSGAAVGRCATPGLQAKFFSYCILSTALVFAYVLLTYGTVRPITAEVARLFGAGANAGAMHAVVALPILLWRLQSRRSVGSFLIVLITLLVVAVSQSRAAYLSAATAFMLWMVLHANARYSRTVRLLASIVLVAALGALAAAFAPETMLRLLNVGRAFSDPLALFGQGQGDLSRVATYYFGWVAYKENPLLGIGYRNLEPFMEERVGFGEASHNLIVTLLAETGLPGTIAFLVLLVVFFRTVRMAIVVAATREEANWRLAIGIAMAVTLLNGMFHQVPEFQYFYLLLGLASSWHTPRRGARTQQRAAPMNRPLPNHC